MYPKPEYPKELAYLPNIANDIVRSAKSYQQREVKRQLTLAGVDNKNNLVFGNPKTKRYYNILNTKYVKTIKR